MHGQDSPRSLKPLVVPADRVRGCALVVGHEQHVPPVEGFESSAFWVSSSPHPVRAMTAVKLAGAAQWAWTLSVRLWRAIVRAR